MSEYSCRLLDRAIPTFFAAILIGGLGGLALVASAQEKAPSVKEMFDKAPDGKTPVRLTIFPETALALPNRLPLTAATLPDAFKDDQTIRGVRAFFATLGIDEDADDLLKIVQNPEKNPQRIVQMEVNPTWIFAAVSRGRDGVVVGPLVKLDLFEGKNAPGWMVYLPSGRRIFVMKAGGNLAYPYSQHRVEFPEKAPVPAKK